MSDLLCAGIEKIKSYFPGFVRFGEGSESFDQSERHYKEELVELFKQTVAESISNFPSERDAQISLGKTITRLFTAPLASLNKKAQNLVGFRYVMPLTKFNDEKNVRWAQLVHDLVSGQEDLASRIDSFVENLKELLSGDAVSFAALSRSVTSFILMLSDPSQHAIIKTQEFNRALKAYGYQTLTGGPLSGTEYLRIQQFLGDISANLANEGLSPRDFIDVQSFIWVNEVYDNDEQSDDSVTDSKEVNECAMSTLHRSPLNRILYGPPGTGKTYRSVAEAVSIIEGVSAEALIADYAQTKKRFDAYRANGQIEFVTFHPSYAYQDFVEGIRPSADDGNITYELEPGVLRRIAKAAVENWALSTTNPSRPDLSDDGHFERVFAQVLSDIDEAEQGYVTSKLYKGYDAEVRAGKKAKSLIITLPGYPTVYNLPLHQLKSLWARRGQVKTPSDTRLYNPSMFWSALRLMEAADAKLEKTPQSGTIESKRYVLIIDEINRGNIAKIFGELITLIEDDKRLGENNQLTVCLPYSQEEFGLPPNLFLVGTMNTADRSIALLDTALRRRFHFTEMMPDVATLPQQEIEGISIPKLLKTINQRIEFLFDRDHMIGHAYFCNVADFSDLEQRLRFKVVPLLQEYFYEDWSRIRLILGDIVEEKTIQAAKLFSSHTDVPDKPRYAVTDTITPELVRAIYT